MPRRILALAAAVACVAVVAYQFLPPPKAESSAELQYVAIGIDEDRSPLVLGVKVQNNSNTDITITGASAQVLWTSLVAGDFSPDNMPPRFSPKVAILNGEPVTIPADSTAEINVEFKWNLDDSAPPAAAACQVVPVLQTKDATLTTEPIAFVVTHKANDEAIKEAGGFRINASESAARNFLDSMESFDGKKSKRIQFLIDTLRKRLNGASEGLAPFI